MSWTRRWCSRARSARSSFSAPRRGASRRSPTTGFWSRRLRDSQGRCPSGTGTPPSRPLETGQLIGRLMRELREVPRAAAVSRLVRGHQLEGQAAENLLQYLEDQARATGDVPDDRTLVVERTRDELGDWRVCILSPLGGRVHAPWSMALTARVRDQLGLDVETMWTNDGIVVRFPDTDTRPTWMRCSPRPTRWRRWSCASSDRRRSSQRSSARTPLAHCSFPDAGLVHGPRSGSSGSAPRISSRWLRSSPPSRSCSRPTASVSGTCSTCRPW